MDPSFLTWADLRDQMTLAYGNGPPWDPEAAWDRVVTGILFNRTELRDFLAVAALDEVEELLHIRQSLRAGAQRVAPLEAGGPVPRRLLPRPSSPEWLTLIDQMRSRWRGNDMEHVNGWDRVIAGIAADPNPSLAFLKEFDDWKAWVRYDRAEKSRRRDRRD